MMKWMFKFNNYFSTMYISIYIQYVYIYTHVCIYIHTHVHSIYYKHHRRKSGILFQGQDTKSLDRDIHIYDYMDLNIN